MAKYNKNLYHHATEQIGGKTRFSGLTLFLKHVSYSYMIFVLLIVVIGFSFVYLNESADADSTFKLAELRTYTIWLSVILILSICGLVFSILKKYSFEFPFGAIASVLNAVVTAGMFTSVGPYLLRHLFPSLLVLSFTGYCFAREINNRKKIKKYYEELSNRLYRAAAAKKKDGIVSSAEHEKAMNEYNGGPIKIEYNTKY